MTVGTVVPLYIHKRTSNLIEIPIETALCSEMYLVFSPEKGLFNWTLHFIGPDWVPLTNQNVGHSSLNVISSWQAYQDIGHHCVTTALHEAMVSRLIMSVSLYILYMLMNAFNLRTVCCVFFLPLSVSLQRWILRPRRRRTLS